MAVRSGRLEKRIHLSLPLQISSFYDPSKTERTTTENVCSLGMRLLTQKAKESKERLMIRSLVGDLRALARVVYCQRRNYERQGMSAFRTSQVRLVNGRPPTERPMWKYWSVPVLCAGSQLSRDHRIHHKARRPVHHLARENR